jgi:hypothetical protein
MNAHVRKNLILAARLVALTLVLAVISGIGSQLLPVTATGGEAASMDSAPAQLTGISTLVILAILLLQVVALAIPIVWSRWHGWRLTATIFIVYFGTVTFMSQIESLVYPGARISGGLVSGLFAMGLFVAAVFSPIAVFTLGKWRKGAKAAEVSGTAVNPGRWGWRVAVAGVVFLCLYYLFGYYVAWQDPELRAYYGGTDPGSFLAQMGSVARSTPWMLPLQFARGLLWVGLGLLVIRSMRGAWWRAGLATALLFAVPSLYLLIPNPIMPEFPRITHLIETLPYQFLFGWFLAWFLSGRARCRGA